MSRSPADRTATVAALRASAAENDGKPRWYIVSASTGASVSTLRRWWALRDKPIVPPRKRVQHDPRMTTPIDWALARFAEADEIIDEARGDGKFTALPALIKLRDLAYADVVALVGDSGRKPKSAEEVGEMLVRAVSKISAAHAQLVLQALRERGIAA